MRHLTPAAQPGHRRGRRRPSALPGLGRHQPAVDGDAQVLQEAVVLGQLGLEGLVSDAGGEGVGGREEVAAGIGGGVEGLLGLLLLLLLLTQAPGQCGGVL